MSTTRASCWGMASGRGSGSTSGALGLPRRASRPAVSRRRSPSTSTSAWTALPSLPALEETRAANGMETDAHARLMVTRGLKHRPVPAPCPSAASGPTVVIIMEHSRPAIPRPILFFATVPHLRGLPMTQDPKLNSHSKLNASSPASRRKKAGADEALMLDVHGFVKPPTPATSSSCAGARFGPSTGDYCMKGITRQKVIDLCRSEGIPVLREELLPRGDLFRPRRPFSPAPSARRRPWVRSTGAASGPERAAAR